MFSQDTLAGSSLDTPENLPSHSKFATAAAYRMMSFLLACLDPPQ